MANKNSRNIGVAIIVGILAVGVFFYLSTEENDLIPTQPATSSPEAPETAPKTEEPVQPTDPAVSELPVDEPVTEVPEQTPPVEAFDKEFLEEQKRITTSYKSLSRLEIDLPENMSFIEVDAGENVAVLYGSEVGGDTKMAIVASKKTAGPEGVSDFLNQNKEAFPMLKERGFKISGNIQTFNAPEDTGLGKITLIPGGEKNGKEVWAAHVQRKDGGGSYVFIVEDHPHVFDNSEESFAALLDTMKAK